jgi:hypothetical protein
MPKASTGDKDRFRGLVESIAVVPGVEIKPMCGQVGAFVNGSKFAGLSWFDDRRQARPRSQRGKALLSGAPNRRTSRPEARLLAEICHPSRGGHAQGTTGSAHRGG